MRLFKKNKHFISKFWVRFKWYRKYKGGTWYKIQVGKGLVVTTPFEFWSRNPPHGAEEYHESLVTKEEYPDE